MKHKLELYSTSDVHFGRRHGLPSRQFYNDSYFATTTHESGRLRIYMYVTVHRAKRQGHGGLLVSPTSAYL